MKYINSFLKNPNKYLKNLLLLRKLHNELIDEIDRIERRTSLDRMVEINEVLPNLLIKKVRHSYFPTEMYKMFDSYRYERKMKEFNTNLIYLITRYLLLNRRVSEVTKYECLINQTNKPILITMIGGMPGGDSESHWIEFIKNAERTNPGQLHICIHPMNQSIRQSLLNKWQQYFLPENKNNFMVCDNDHWVSTTWGTVSLSFGTLMAIQYALKQNGYCNQFYKKVMFIQQGAPLYRFEVINEILNEDNKSWFKTRDGAYPGWQYTSPYDFNRKDDPAIEKEADIGDWNWFSAIFALDSSHMNIFFNNGVNTWKKEGTYSCFGKIFENIKTNDKTKQNFLTQVTGNWNYDDLKINKNSCVNSDETFFGVAFKSYFDGNKINDNVRFIDDTLINQNIKNNYFIKEESKEIHYLYDTPQKLKPIISFPKFGDTSIPDNSFGELNSYTPQELKDNHLIYLPRVIWWRKMANINNTNQHPIYIGMDVKFNPEDLKRYNSVRNLNPKRIIHKGVIENIDGKTSAQINSLVLSGGNIKIRDTNITSSPDHYTDLKKFTSLTYHDWSSFSLLPNNLLRSAKVKVNGSNDDLYNHVRDKNTTEFVNFIKSNNEFSKIGEKRVTYHPAEYGTTNMREIVNTFNLLTRQNWWSQSNSGLNPQPQPYAQSSQSNQGSQSNTWTDDQSKTNWKSENEFRLFTIALFIFETVILKFRKWITIDNEGFITITDSNIEEIEVGTPLTPDILSSAITSGSLFIRKVINGSRINNYSNQLFSLNRNPKNISYRDDLEGKEYIFAPNMFNEKSKENSYYFRNYKFNKTKGITYQTKYLKYKEKYLKLKNELLYKKLNLISQKIDKRLNDIEINEQLENSLLSEIENME